MEKVCVEIFQSPRTTAVGRQVGCLLTLHRESSF